MNSVTGPHLDTDQIVRALVDTGDLSGDQQRHLSGCPRCSAEKRRLEQGLAGLAREARRLAPRPAGPIRLPPKIAGKPLLPLRWLLPAVALAAASVLLLVLWPPPWYQPTPTGGLRQAVLPNDEDDALFSQVDALVEDAMPAELAAITGLDDTPDGDVTQFIVPSVSAVTPLSLMAPHAGGTHRC